jgi:hypothetical protein
MADQDEFLDKMFISVVNTHNLLQQMQLYANLLDREVLEQHRFMW